MYSTRDVRIWTLQVNTIYPTGGGKRFRKWDEWVCVACH